MEKSLYETINEIDPVNVDVLNNILEENEISVDLLPTLNSEHIKELIPKLSLRVHFENKLKSWNHQNERPSCSKDSANDCLVNLKKCLGQSYDNLCRSYKRAGILTEGNRRIIVNNIFSYCKDKNVKVTNRVMEDLSHQIKVHFPSENTLSWYSNHNGKAKGRIVFKKYNFARSTTRKTKKVQEEVKPQNDVDMQELSEINVIECKALQNYLRNQKSNVTEILSCWKKTATYRISKFKDMEKDKNIRGILQEWPSYKLSIGHSLLEIDFNTMFPHLEKMSFKTWPNITANLKKYLDNNCKDKYCQQILSLIDGNTSSESADACLLYVLHSVLKPSSTKKDGKHIRYSIRDSQNTFLKHIDHPNLLREQTNIQPHMFVLGESLMDVSEIYIQFDNITYRTESVLEALTCCFHVYTVFNFEYPVQSRNVWRFLQYHIFGVKIPKDNMSAAALSLSTYLDSANSETVHISNN